MSDEAVDAFLEHHGILGMRWGVRRDHESSGGRSGSSPEKLSAEEKAVLDAVGNSEADSVLRRAKYGPEGGSHKLTEKQKSYLKTAAKVGLGVGLVYGLSKLGENAQVNSVLGKEASPQFKNFWKGYQHSGIPFDFNNLPTERISLGPGSILSRISSAKEDHIRPGGFYAAFKKEDVTRYKAALPIYWKQWGVHNPDGGGYHVQIKALKGVKAPSQKEAFEIFNDMMKKRGEVLPSSNRRRGEIFLGAAHRWIDHEDPLTKNYFEHLKAWGFNSVLDFNDAGRLGESPLRLLDSSEFQISKVVGLPLSSIRQAQSTITKVAHSIEELIHNMNENVDIFLAHHGVKGMKWGVRRTRRVQKILDRHNRIATGTASKKDRLLGANRFVFTAQGAKRQLQRGANNQAKIAAGKHKAASLLLKVNGIHMNELNYHTKGNPNAKMDRGQKAALAAGGAAFAVQLLGAVAAKKM